MLSNHSMNVDLKIDKSIKYPGYTAFSKRKCLIVLNSLSIETLKHEVIHLKQYFNNKFHLIKYLFSDKYRLKSELEAYSEKIEKLSLDEIEDFSRTLKYQYSLSINLCDINLEIFKLRNKLQIQNKNMNIHIGIEDF